MAKGEGMSDWKSCGNCQREDECRYWSICIPQEDFPLWRPLPCPKCGGTLSEIRVQGGKRLRHCYSCHFEFYLEGER